MARYSETVWEPTGLNTEPPVEAAACCRRRFNTCVLGLYVCSPCVVCGVCAACPLREAVDGCAFPEKCACVWWGAREDGGSGGRVAPTGGRVWMRRARCYGAGARGACARCGRWRVRRACGPSGEWHASRCAGARERACVRRATRELRRAGGEYMYGGVVGWFRDPLAASPVCSLVETSEGANVRVRTLLNPLNPYDALTLYWTATGLGVVALWLRVRDVVALCPCPRLAPVRINPPRIIKREDNTQPRRQVNPGERNQTSRAGPVFPTEALHPAKPTNKTTSFEYSSFDALLLLHHGTRVSCE